MKMQLTQLALFSFMFSAVADTSESRKLRSTQRRAQASNATLSFDPATTALIVVDPQNDFLSPDGVAWGVVGASVVEHDVVNNIEKLFKASADNGFLTFISPHFYYPHDHKWEFEGTLEKVMHDIGMFNIAGPQNLTNFEGSGADWLDVYKPYIAADNVIITNPHKVYGPETNDLVLQLRKRKIDSVILSGMSANLCVESHMRALTEQGFEVLVVADATAGGITDDLGDGYMSALTNFKFIASGVYFTDETVLGMEQSFVAVDKNGV